MVIFDILEMKKSSGWAFSNEGFSGRARNRCADVWVVEIVLARSNDDEDVLQR